MRFEDEHKERTDLKTPAQETLQDVELERALNSFRESVHSWSEVELSRPRTLAAAGRRKSWRPATGWALGCLLMLGAVSGGYYRVLRLAELHKDLALREAARQHELVLQQAKDEEDLLAKVDSDVSRDVPSAMEPLAQLMAEDETR